jgi:HTH-type transcriptional regulator / antitoxin HigA
MTEQAAFQPDWTSPPGSTISRILDREGIPVAHFAWELDLAEPDVDALCKGKLRIDEGLASRLEKVLGVAAEFWLTREAQFRGDNKMLAERVPATDAKNWLRSLPTKDMKAFGWIVPQDTQITDLAECLRFFDVSSVQHYEERINQLIGRTKFRTSASFKSNPNALSAWLRFGEIQADMIDCEPWNRDKFRSVLPVMRKLTHFRDPNLFIPKLRNLCASAGVALVVARAPTGCRASGATMFLSEQKAVLLLSFRHLSDDHFWFSFFHECGHLILHPENLLIVEGEGDDEDPLEDEANRFAEDVLIPPPWKQLLSELRPNQKDIVRFAIRAGIAPGIVVGQLQHRGQLRHGFLNYLKRRYTWS